MCGIAGIVTLDPSKDLRPAMGEMLKAQAHRGPDHSGMYQADTNVLLGHNRLSIIDLSSEADQPFVSADGRYALVFNGEIYNYLELKIELKDVYPFRTNSDTEVLMAAWMHWGPECLDRFRGMFAFALYDRKKKIMHLVRDRFGVKPLYYTRDDAGNFFFASEIKSLFAAGTRKIPNEVMWATYLVHGQFQLNDQCFWKGIYQLPTGHRAEINVTDFSITLDVEPWYHFVERIHALRNDPIYQNRNESEHIEVYKALMEESIQLRFRSDVPVGFNISGGLDSSVLLGAVNKIFPQDKVEAFTFYTGDERYDELPWVDELIAQTNKPLNRVLLTADEVPDLAESVSFFQDEPFGGIPTLAYSKIFHAAREKGMIVLLDGQGMDEAWAGYDYYHQVGEGIVQGVISSPFKPEVLMEDFRLKAQPYNYPKPFEDDLLNKQYRDLFYTKIPRALRFNDRISMMHSTELREPFLDHLLVEYAFALPASMKLRNGQTKWALRRMAEDYLQGELHLAPKRPLQTPQREWLTDDLKDWVVEEIYELRSHPWFQTKALKEEWEAFLDSEKDNTFFLWQWCSIGT